MTWCCAAQPGQPASDLDRGAAADPGVDLVEDHDRYRVGAGQHDLQREHDPGQFTARGALLQRDRLRVRMRWSRNSTSSTPSGPAADPRLTAGQQAMAPRRRRPVARTDDVQTASAMARPAQLGGHRGGQAGRRGAGPRDSSSARVGRRVPRARSRRGGQFGQRLVGESICASRRPGLVGPGEHAGDAGAGVGVLADQACRAGAARLACGPARGSASIDVGVGRRARRRDVDRDDQRSFSCSASARKRGSAPADWSRRPPGQA